MQTADTPSPLAVLPWCAFAACHRGSAADSSRASLARAPPCAVQPWTYLASRFAAPVARPMALHGADAYDPVAVLPSPLARKVFKRLPADQRARAALVCRRWRAALADPSLWTKLDLSSGGGVVCRVYGDVLRAAAARACGGLVALAVPLSDILFAPLLAVVAENATTLPELSLDGRALFNQRELNENHLLDLLLLAPALQTVTVANMLAAGFLRARQVLRSEPPYGPIRVQRLLIEVGNDVSDVPGFVADMVTHQSLTGLSLYRVTGEQNFKSEELDLILCASCTMHLTDLAFHGYCPMPENAPALARLISSSFLTLLFFQSAFRPADRFNAGCTGSCAISQSDTRQPNVEDAILAQCGAVR